MANYAKDAILGFVKAVMGPIRDLIELIGKIKIPKLPNTRLPGPLMLPPAVASAGTGVSSTRAGSSGRAGAGSPLTINVYGAIDPEGTARAIRRVLERHDRRQGRTV